MLVTTNTIKKNQQKQEMNAEADIQVESECQGTVLCITICPVILCFPEYIKNLSTDETTNMRALDIPISLVIHCVCIYDIIYSLA